MPKLKPRRKTKNNPRAVGGRQPLTDVLAQRPMKLVRQGIRRAGDRRPAPKKPLTERHLAVLGALTEEPQGATAIAAQLDLIDRQVTGALYVLQARGLALRVGHGMGWVKDGD